MLTGIVLAAALAQDAIEYRLLKGPDYVVFEDGITPRARVRANYYTKNEKDEWGNSPGQISIEYGLPAWKAEYDAVFEKMPKGKRWRLGSNYWTNLASTLPFEVSGKQVKAGYYFLVLERNDPGPWNLVLLDPAEVTRRQMDPYHVNLRDSGPGISLPLKWERVDKAAEKLAITLKLHDRNPKEMRIHIHFGRHHFETAPLTIKF
jgi:hypothetical protein